MIYGYCNNSDVLSARVCLMLCHLVSWNAMIGGYCQINQLHEALKLFHELHSSTRCMNQKSLGALELDEGVHHFFWREKLDRAVTCVDVCAKCGEISKARRVFGEMPKKETATWNALINGHASEALEAFSEMQQEGNKPNYDINMIGVFSACCHGRIWAYPKK